jgi:hypothetical protein
MLFPGVGATRDGDARNSNAATQAHSDAAHIGFARTSSCYAFGSNGGICPIDQRNQLSDVWPK